jgi:hypothetical protein
LLKRYGKVSEAIVDDDRVLRLVTKSVDVSWTDVYGQLGLIIDNNTNIINDDVHVHDFYPSLLVSNRRISITNFIEEGEETLNRTATQSIHSPSSFRVHPSHFYDIDTGNDVVDSFLNSWMKDEECTVSFTDLNNARVNDIGIINSVLILIRKLSSGFKTLRIKERAEDSDSGLSDIEEKEEPNDPMNLSSLLNDYLFMYALDSDEEDDVLPDGDYGFAQFGGIDHLDFFQTGMDSNPLDVGSIVITSPFIVQIWNKATSLETEIVTKKVGKIMKIMGFSPKYDECRS